MEQTLEEQALREKLNGIFRDIFEDDSIRIREEMTAHDVEGWDSLNHINLIVAVERAFRISFTTKEVGSMKNVGEFIGLIRRKSSP